MERPTIPASELISFAVMFLMFIALAAGEAGDTVRRAASPALEVSAELEYFRGEDE